MNKAINIIIQLETNPGMQTSQNSWFIQLQAAGAIDSTREIDFKITIGGAGEWNSTIKILAIGSSNLIEEKEILIFGYEDEDEIPKVVDDDEELSGIESYIEMLGPAAPHITPMSLAIVAGVFILLQFGKIWSSGRNQRKAKEEFIKNRIKQRTKPPLPNTMIRNSTSASQIKPSHHKSDNMRQFTNNSFNQNSNDDLLDDLI